MRINLCVNGNFRYPRYARHYAQAGVLGRFYFAHRRTTSPESLGLQRSQACNVWPKEYALHAAARWLPPTLFSRAEHPIYDLWQQATMSKWQDCDSVETVIGGVADRVLAFAKAQGCRTLGHPVCAHPDTVAPLVGRAYADLGLDPARAAPPCRERRLAEIELCDRLLVDSRFVAQSFAAAGVARDRIKLITPGVDLARFHPRRPEERDAHLFRVVCVATITPRKAQHVLLRAWRRLNLPKAELVLVGPMGRHAEPVLQGFKGGFVHHHRIANGMLRQLLVRASVFVLPSVEDGCPQAPVEAMACGVPVIVTANCGTADVVTEGRDGFVVPAFDVETLAARIETLYRDQDKAQAMGEAAANSAARHGSWSAYAEQVIALHRSMAEPGSRQEAA